MDTKTQLLREVEEYLSSRNIAPTAFGIAAVNDGKFVSRLRSRTNMTLATIEKVRAHIEKSNAAVQPQTSDASQVVENG